MSSHSQDSYPHKVEEKERLLEELDHALDEAYRLQTRSELPRYDREIFYRIKEGSVNMLVEELGEDAFQVLDGGFECNEG